MAKSGTCSEQQLQLRNRSKQALMLAISKVPELSEHEQSHAWEPPFKW